MRATDALEELRRFAAGRRSDVSRLRASDAVNLMAGFYRDVRADGCDPQQAEDLLMVDCGAGDGVTGGFFELDLVRQLFLPGWEPNAEGVVEDADDRIWQLHLTLRFPRTPALRAPTGHGGCCSSPEELDAFLAELRDSDAYAAVRDRSDAEVVLRYECAG